MATISRLTARRPTIGFSTGGGDPIGTRISALANRASTLGGRVAPTGGGIQDPNSSVQGGKGTGIAPPPARPAYAPGSDTRTASNLTPNPTFSAAAQTAPIPRPGVSPGGSGGNGSALNYAGDPWTGFAHQYVPGKADDIFSNPGIVLQDVLRGMGIQNPEQSGFYAELEPLADVINEIMLLMNPNADAAGSPESAVNYFSNFFTQMATPGGRAPDFRTMERALSGADPTSALGLFLGGGDTQRDQMQNYLKLGRAAGQIGLHPYYADAYNKKLAMAANAYMNATAKGDMSDFAPFVNEQYGSYF